MKENKAGPGLLMMNVQIAVTDFDLNGIETAMAHIKDYAHSVQVPPAEIDLLKLKPFLSSPDSRIGDPFFAANYNGFKPTVHYLESLKQELIAKAKGNRIEIAINSKEAKAATDVRKAIDELGKEYAHFEANERKDEANSPSPKAPKIDMLAYANMGRYAHSLFDSFYIKKKEKKESFFKFFIFLNEPLKVNFQPDPKYSKSCQSSQNKPYIPLFENFVRFLMHDFSFFKTKTFSKKRKIFLDSCSYQILRPTPQHAPNSEKRLLGRETIEWICNKQPSQKHFVSHLTVL